MRDVCFALETVSQIGNENLKESFGIFWGFTPQTENGGYES
jgi:hypothetical protein